MPVFQEEKTRSKAVHLLLNKAADVNIQDDSGRTALSYACEMRCNDIVRILVKNNVDPDIADEKGKNTGLVLSICESKSNGKAGSKFMNELKQFEILLFPD